jgi:hypothetical protein
VAGAERGSSPPLGDAERAEDGQLLNSIPFGHDAGAEMIGERDQSGGECLPGAIGLDAGDQCPVELDHVRHQVQDVAQAREPSTGVVDGQADAELPNTPERVAEQLVVPESLSRLTRWSRTV